MVRLILKKYFPYKLNIKNSLQNLLNARKLCSYSYYRIYDRGKLGTFGPNKNNTTECRFVTVELNKSSIITFFGFDAPIRTVEVYDIVKKNIRDFYLKFPLRGV